MGDVTKIGPTGEFPDGKLNADDEGGLNIQIAHDEKSNVIVNFGKQVAWLAMPAPDAANLALTILAHAGAKLTVNLDDAMIKRATEFVGKAQTGLQGEAWIRALLQFALNGQES